MYNKNKKVFSNKSQFSDNTSTNSTKRFVRKGEVKNFNNFERQDKTPVVNKKYTNNSSSNYRTNKDTSKNSNFVANKSYNNTFTERSFKPKTYNSRPQTSRSFKSDSGFRRVNDNDNNRNFEKSPSRFPSRSLSGHSSRFSSDSRSQFNSNPSSRSFDNSSRKTFGGFSSRVFRPKFNKSKQRGEFIEYSKFIHKPDPSQKNEVKKIEVKHTFQDFNLDKTLETNLKNKGYETPTPIQDQTIAHALMGQDVLGLANTGSGKTAAFLIPLINKVALNPKGEKVLIMAPTRELAQQIEKELRDFSIGMKIFSTLCVGGMPIFRQISNLRMTNQFIIGTPGRLKDLSDRRCINFKDFNNIVLDEVDHMLDMGFIDDITFILGQLNAEKQSLFFSATMPLRIKNLVQKFLNNPFTVDIVVPGSTKSVEQDIVRSNRENKFDTLCKLLEDEGATRTIIFVETKREVDEITDMLRDKGYKSGSLHGDKRQRERSRTLDHFKNDIINILVATDVAARGIDVKDVSHVINYTIPQTHDSYVHRIGRAGRAGKTGKAFTFVN